jgi:hypothetical protein
MYKRDRKTKKKSPSIPVARLIQEANDLYLFCKNDRKELIGEGIDWDEVEKLPELLNECSDAEVEYQVYRKNAGSEIVKLKKLVLRCRKLRTTIAEKLRSAVSRAGNFMTVPSYRKSWSRAELVQDLNDLAVIGKDIKHMFNHTGFDLTLLDLAADLSVELSEKIIDVIISKPSKSRQKTFRDKTMQELLSLIVQIRKTGKSAFFDNPLRRKAYACEYLRERKLMRKRKPAPSR